jgi:hypothetical protein
MGPAAIHVNPIDDEKQFSFAELEIIPLTLLPRDTQRQLYVWRI